MSGGMDLSTFPEENPVLRVQRDGDVLFANQAGRECRVCSMGRRWRWPCATR